MTILDLFAEDAVARAPRLLLTDEELGTIAERARELHRADQRVKRLKLLLQLAESNRHRLSTDVLPKLMDRSGADSVGVSDGNCDVVMRTIYHANIAADWREEDRAAAFSHLETLGGGDLIRSHVTVKLPAGDIEIARRIEYSLRKRFPQADIDAGQAIPWGTLTSFVKSYLEREPLPGEDPTLRPPIDLTKLGATVVRQARVEQRKLAKSQERNRGKRGAAAARK